MTPEQREAALKLATDTVLGYTYLPESEFPRVRELARALLSEHAENVRLREIIQQWFDYEKFCYQKPPYDSAAIYLEEGRRLWFKFREDARAALSGSPATED